MVKKEPHLVIKEENCSGCRRCQLTCSFHLEGVFNPALAYIKVLLTTEKGISYRVYCTEECLECYECADACVFGCLVLE